MARKDTKKATQRKRVSDCVRQWLKKGKSQKQAVAACVSIERQASRKKRSGKR